MPDSYLIKSVIKGLVTFIPGISNLLSKIKAKSKHSCYNAEFCYTLWLSFLVLLREKGIQTNLKKVGEIGNGGSLGVGICSLLSGSEKFYALEINQTYDKDQNLKLLDEITELFKNKTEISNKFRQLNISIQNFEYPEELISPLFLDNKLVEEIKNDILNGFIDSKRIEIIHNWESHSALDLDVVFSRAVMEHVAEPGKVYKAINKHLKKGSFVFHDIEFHSHGITKSIDGHYRIPGFLWKIIYGKRKHFLNRWSLQDHINCMTENGFELIETNEKSMIDSSDGIKKLQGATVLTQKASA
jgi:hypothetical protein